MLDWITAVAILLLALGVIGSAIPGVPGPILSLLGVYIYWWNTGYTEPGLILLFVLTVMGVVAIGIEVIGSIFAAHYGGASNRTIIIAILIGFVFLVFTGPVGMIIAVFVTVFALEYSGDAPSRSGFRPALYTTIGILGSMAGKVLLTFTMLLAILVVVIF